jgi:hypothetical protein
MIFLCAAESAVSEMQIHISGAMSIQELKQTLFEKLNEIEDEYAVGFSKGATLYFHPTDELGEEVILMKAGRRVNKILTNGPYKSAAVEFQI